MIELKTPILSEENKIEGKLYLMKNIPILSIQDDDNLSGVKFCLIKLTSGDTYYVNESAEEVYQKFFNSKEK